MNNFLLEIVSPEGKIFSGEVTEVSLPTTTGEITILPNHADLYSKLAPGEAVIHKNGKLEYVAILEGFVEVGDNKVTVLADFATVSDKISAAKAQQAKERAEKLLQEKSSEQDFSLIERDLQKSILELQVAEKVKKRHHN